MCDVIILLYLYLILLVEGVLSFTCQQLQCQAGTTSHCITNERQEKRNICLGKKFIPGGHCPYYNTYQGNLDVRPCNSTIHEDCPKYGIYSNEGQNYKGCINLERHTKRSTTFIGFKETTILSSNRKSKPLLEVSLSTVEPIQTETNKDPEFLQMPKGITSKLTDVRHEGVDSSGPNIHTILIAAGLFLSAVIAITVGVLIRKRGGMRDTCTTKHSSEKTTSSVSNDIEQGLTPEGHINSEGPEANQTERIQANDETNSEIQVRLMQLPQEIVLFERIEYCNSM